ncbi:MAG: HupE/UreJ family protein, partial [Sphingomonadaceae bacterium]|nr:HupE/UreJ family protein [Sphingomonadaceae bacterium]
SSPAAADELRPGYLEFSQQSESEWLLVWKAPVRGDIAARSQPILPEPCTMGEPVRERVPQAIVTRWPVTCEESVLGQSIGLSNFESSMTDVLLRVAPLSEPVQAIRLTADAPMADIAARADGWQVARTYFWLGVEHILFGFDHLLFVLALVLLLKGGWTIAKAVTAFTVAHSITLVGVTLGFIGLPQRPVEAVIALSILFLAVEIVKRREGEPRLSDRLPWLVALIFGLLHGFGFAGALAEIGLPEGEVPVALLTFNLGVEAGQLAIVFAGLGVVALIRRLAEPALRPAVQLSAYAIGSVAAYWFIERTIA